VAIDIGRRKLIVALVTAAAWPLAARGQQQTAVPVIGFLSSQSPAPFASLTAAFLQGLKEAGFVDGKNVAIEYRWAEGQFDRLPALAADLVAREVTVIVATGGEPSVFAAKAATNRIPIVFTAGGDPVRQGLVDSLNRPGGNLTGMFFLATAVESKRLGLLRELVPNAAKIAVLWNPNSPGGAPQLREIQDAAHAVGQELIVLGASSETEIDKSFAAIADHRIGALLVAADPLFTNRRDQILALAAHHALPAIYYLREFAAFGALMSYGASLPEAFRQVGTYTGRILNREKPGDLPIMQPTKFELIINLKTAKALGLSIPATLLAQADEVIE
jgi:putative ABC transport system substrate-binding protein